MTTRTIPIRELVTQHYENARIVCKVGTTTIFSAMHQKRYWLLAAGTPMNMATICEYDDWKEWQEEMAVLRRAAMGGGEGGPPDIGVTADLPPSPPATPASNAHALSVSGEVFLPS